jgi:cation diffusion facilitator family transporter
MTQPAPAPDHVLAKDSAEGDGGSESTGTVVVAGLANLGIAIAKLVGGLISHSSAMMSEAAHSLADTITEVLLFVALKRGAKDPDERHPIGYGRETYFWALLACLATFTLGAGFSFWQGITTIVEGEDQGDPLIAYIVLAISFVLEGASWLKAVRQVRSSARKWGTTPRRYLAETSDTTVKAVTFEDSAALVGLVLAALGLFLEHLTGDPMWDGVAAIAIGVLLLVVAGALGKANVSLLVGKSVSPSIEAQFRRELAQLDQVSDVPVLLTTVIGPGQLIVMAKVDFDDTATVADVERASDEAERRLVARHDGVRYVFLDPTQGDGRARARAHRPAAGEPLPDRNA